MSIFKVALPIGAALLLILLFMALPNLKYCVIPGDKMQISPENKSNFRRGEAVFLILLCAVYGFAAFFKLGNTSAPQSFSAMEGNTAVLSLESESVPAHIMLYTGIGTGSYDIAFSQDGKDFHTVASFKQSHDTVLKWHDIALEAPESCSFISITCTDGSPYLGEVCIAQENHQQLPLQSDNFPQLADEQKYCPLFSNYLNSTYFDEIYHVRTAWEHLHGIWPYEISHPPLGKLIISAGISMFGMTPFGWRFAGTLSGVLMLPLMYFLLKRIFGSKTVAGLGTIIFASDFMHLVQTRIATIDSYAVFFILLMYLFMYGFYAHGNRRDLALSGIFFGLGAASKWTCIYAGAGLAVLWLMYWIRSFIEASRAEEKTPLPFKEFIINCLFCLLFFVAIPCVIYYLSYIPYGIALDCGPFSKEYFDMVIHNQEFMLNYHVNVQAEHPYASRWYQWMLDIRPILYYLQYFDDGSRSSISAFLNPILCWGGLLSMFVVIYEAAFRRDKKAAFILVGYLAQLVPWFFIKRLTFEYHYFPSSVFLVLAMGYVFDVLRLNCRGWLKKAIPVAAASVVLFIMFYPALTGLLIDNKLGTALLGWLPTWPL